MRTIRRHVEHAAVAPVDYVVRLDGTLDGEMTRDPRAHDPWDQAFEPNLCVRMENVGDQTVVNPWLIANGRDWRSVQSVVAGVIRPEMTDAQKAMSLWRFHWDQRFHASPYDEDNCHIVKLLNVYGYSLCSDDALCLADLWREAGLAVREAHPPNGHICTEVWFDGAWHLLDGDVNVFYLMRNNVTVAGVQDIVRDHDLIKRTHTFGPLSADDRQRDEWVASVFLCETPFDQTKRALPPHVMALRLRPDEALEWRWDYRGKRHGRDRGGGLAGGVPLALARIANGRLIYRPDLRSERWRAGLVGLAGLSARGPFPDGATGEAVFEMRSPYVMVGGRLRAVIRRPRLASRLDLALSFDRETWHLLAFAGAVGDTTVSISLDPFFPPDGPARYAFFLRISAREAGLTDLTVACDLQMAPLSLPALRLGDNTLRYVDDSSSRVVRITHAWRECNDQCPPDPPPAPVFPRDGESPAGSRFTFQWVEAAHVDGIADYHIQVGASPDLPYALSPNFEKLISRTPDRGRPQYTIPYEGLLNPGQTYDWRVRARSPFGAWSAWSPVWRFTPQGPGVPLDPRVSTDNIDGALELTWTPNPAGTAPATYIIYGSNERGFTASDDPYPVLVENQRTAVFPSNRIGETAEPHWRVEWGERSFAYYRIVACDAEGIRSGPSDLAETPCPHIWSRPPQIARSGVTFRYLPQTAHSIGDLRNGARIPNQTYSPAFRNADRLTFALEEAPNWLSIDPLSGQLRGIPRQTGRIRVALRVADQRGRSVRQVFTLDVQPPME